MSFSVSQNHGIARHHLCSQGISGPSRLHSISVFSLAKTHPQLCTAAPMEGCEQPSRSQQHTSCRGKKGQESGPKLRSGCWPWGGSVTCCRPAWRGSHASRCRALTVRGQLHPAGTGWGTEGPCTALKETRTTAKEAQVQRLVGRTLLACSQEERGFRSTMQPGAGGAGCRGPRALQRPPIMAGLPGDDQSDGASPACHVQQRPQPEGAGKDPPQLEGAGKDPGPCLVLRPGSGWQPAGSA